MRDLDNLLRFLQQMPYLASKNIYKVASFFLEADKTKIDQFCELLKSVNSNIISCENCHAWYDKNQICTYCDKNSRRNLNLICVVSSWQDLLALEKTQGYTGSYHILNGLICPLEGIGPEDLYITSLINRVKKILEDKNNNLEIILALSQTPEGETTSAYIADKLSNLKVEISCLARGVPVGSMIEYMDRVTLYKAFSERRPF